MQTLNIVGGGRVGQTLARLWHVQNTFHIQDVLTTSMQSAQQACFFIGAGHPVDALQSMRPADVWMLATPDAQIAATATALADAQGHAPHQGAALESATPAIAFHCSGALGATQLAPLAALGWQTASAHCILSFASAPAAVAQFAGTPCALEGDPGACAVLRPAFTAIGAQCFDLKSEHKLLYHAAAVFATNFLPVLQAVAEDAWRSSGVPTELIPGLRSSLLHNAVANITAHGPAQALTGPAARGDIPAINRQSAAVTAWDPQAGAAYAALSALALRLAGHNGK
jgi:predicted short-subunit dehydrogenase-like oxidoreductase (DUF2520 family)